MVWRSGMTGKIFACLRDIGTDLPGQRCKIGIALLVPELMHEFDVHAATIDWFIEIEYEDFEQRPGVRLDGRAHAQAGNARARRCAEAVHPHREDSAESGLVPEHDIGCRKTEAGP